MSNASSSRRIFFSLSLTSIALFACHGSTLTENEGDRYLSESKHDSIKDDSPKNDTSLIYQSENSFLLEDDAWTEEESEVIEHDLTTIHKVGSTYHYVKKTTITKSECVPDEKDYNKDICQDVVLDEDITTVDYEICKGWQELGDFLNDPIADGRGKPYDTPHTFMTCMNPNSPRITDFNVAPNPKEIWNGDKQFKNDLPIYHNLDLYQNFSVVKCFDQTKDEGIQIMTLDKRRTPFDGVNYPDLAESIKFKGLTAVLKLTKWWRKSEADVFNDGKREFLGNYTACDVQKHDQDNIQIRCTDPNLNTVEQVYPISRCFFSPLSHERIIDLLPYNENLLEKIPNL